EKPDIALRQCAAQTDLEGVKKCISCGANVDNVGKAGNSAIMITDNVEKARILIERGASMDLVNNFGDNALANRARSAKDLDSMKNDQVFQLLLEREASLENKIPFKTPKQLALDQIISNPSSREGGGRS
ncbi:MAG: hypothetical protein SFT91_01655, partial [Rickettsiaceae bacterium]|nr:hypothetical protein [Rickettsiaceae bacterium]